VGDSAGGSGAGRGCAAPLPSAFGNHPLYVETLAAYTSVPPAEDMPVPMLGLNHRWLMRESERRLEAATESGTPDESLWATRLLGDGAVFKHWESEHARHMREIARERRRQRQLGALRSVTFGVIHRKALFEYLRTEAPRGEERRRVVALFHGARAYSDALIAEHRSFIRSTCSHLCANHIGAEVLGDREFAEPFEEYERLFREYFQLYCRALTAGPEAAGLDGALLPCLKFEINVQRRLILAGRAAPRSLSAA
jgi:hypothetical protein